MDTTVNDIKGTSHIADKTTPRSGWVRAIIAECMLACSMFLLAFAGYQAFWTDIASGQKQNVVSDNLASAWGGYVNPRGAVTPELGDAFARLYIPSFGSDFQFAVVEGVTDADLEVGPGHYPETQMPGEDGNVALAGHRVGMGSPFNDLDRLNTCDDIVLETQTMWSVYKVMPMEAGTGADCFSPEDSALMSSGQYSGVVGRHITTPEDVSVIDKVPGMGDGDPATMREILTLTTCHPQFSNAERMIVHAMKVEEIDKSSGQRPAVMDAEVA